MTLTRTRTLAAFVVLVVAALAFNSASAAAAWTASTASAPAGTAESRLYGVSCTGEICWAVGDYRASAGATLEPFAYQTLSSGYALPPAPAGKSAELTDVSCKANNFCMAVGQFVNKSGDEEGFAEKWTATSGWVLQTLTFPTGTYWSELFSISCSSGSECMAVGDFHDSTGMHYLAEHWTTSLSWVPETPPGPAVAGYLGLTAISCPATSKCTAVGQYQVSPYGPTHAEVEGENYTGTWEYQGAPSISAMSFPFGSVPGPVITTDSCVTSKECVGVGWYTTTGTPAALEGTAWEYKPALTPGWKVQTTASVGGENLLHGVYCWTTSECYAVGRYESGSAWLALLEEHSGTSWTQTAVPSPTGTRESYLSRDACFEEKRFCSLVGWWENGSHVIKALVELNF